MIKKTAKKKPIVPRDDRAFIEDPMRWPHLQLPMRKKLYRDRIEPKGMGIMIAMSDKKKWPEEKIMPVILHLYLFRMPSLDHIKNPTLVDLVNYCKEKDLYTEYPSLQALLDDGWEVD